MSPLPSHPKLRWPLDIRIDSYEGKKIIIFNCPLGISEQPLVLIEAVSPILHALDGSRSIEELVTHFAPYGIQSSLIEELLEILDKHLLLVSPAFFAAQADIIKNFKESSVRPAALAGRGYALTKELLKSEIDQYLINGIPKDPNKNLIGLVSPHIDYRRGGVCYGKTYTSLAQADHDLYILIGTAHQYSKNLFHLTKKDFVNPLGILECEKTFVDELAKLYGRERSFEDEFLHKREHSLELQIPFMSYMIKTPKIVPILVGSFYHLLQNDKLPSSDEKYETFAQALSHLLGEYMKQGKRVCIIAGVDMAHVGRHFGDDFNLSPEYMKEINQRDHIYLSSIATHNKKLMFDHVAEDTDKRRICGFPTMYTVLDVFSRIGVKFTADIFDYSQAVDYNSQCAVTFAGMGLYNSALK